MASDPAEGSVRVTILTDFGTADGYAAALAGVVASLAPGAVVDHASHAIDPGDLRGAALALSRYAFLYPEGTVHVVVVDPGVGTARRALVARVDGRYFVAPDNGVLTPILAAGSDSVLVSVEDEMLESKASATFHGRDIFAPTAARLANGTPVHALGPPLDDPVLLDWPEAQRDPHGQTVGEVLEVDRFGNLVTNVPADWLEAGARVWVEETEIGPVRRTYGEVEPGEPLALVGSIGMLEVSVRDASAAARFEAGRGARIIVRVER